MTWFTSAYKALAHLAPNWDTQLRADMALLETNLQQGTWSPAFAGGAGATVGTSGGTDGYVSRQGQKVDYVGRILFGSSAVFGNGVITGFNQYGTNNQAWLQGSGFYIFAGDPLHPRPVTLIPQATSELVAWVGPTLARLTTLGTPTAGDQLIFTATGIAS